MCAVEITEPAALIRIAKLYSEKLSPLELYEAVRGVWRIGPRRDRVRLALAIAEGTVVEVYEVRTWHVAGTTPYMTRPPSQVQLPQRWEFSGNVAPADARAKYVGKSVAHYFPRGSVNPFIYVNV